MRVRSYLISTVCLASLAVPSLAEDLESSSGHNWSGLYFGVYGGYAMGSGMLEDAWCRANIGNPDPNNCSDPADPGDNPELYGAKLDSDVVTLGVLAGFNHQFASGLVLGVESDFGHGGTAEGNFVGTEFGTYEEHTGKVALTVSGSTRLRVGMAMDSWLPFVTAGVAYAKYDADKTHTPDAGLVDRYGSGNLVGWTAGAGVNYALTPNTIFGLEYRYTDFGTDSVLMFSNDDLNVHTYDVSVQQHEVRASLAYTLGAAHGSSGSGTDGGWSGPYLGVFAGYALATAESDNSYCRLNPGDCGGGTYGAPMDDSAATFGALIGYNHQFDSGLVLGVEGDIGLGGEAEGNFVHGVDGVNPDHTAKFDIGLSGSARLRAGIAVESWLPYLTAGVAYAQYDVSMANPNQADNNRNGSGSLVGWTAGAGINYAMTNDAILGFEYRYTDYGDDTHYYTSAADTNFWTQEGFFKQHELRASLAYKF